MHVKLEKKNMLEDNLNVSIIFVNKCQFVGDGGVHNEGTLT